METGKIDVRTENIFPIIKKFLYSDHEIFLRELISNAVDATQKLKTLSSVGELKGDIGDITIEIAVNKEAKTITITDKGIGLTDEEVKKYINQVAFSGAEEFVEKYKDKADAIIGHFGLGFYSAFMVSKKVEINSLSYKEGSEAIHWECTGDPEFILDKGTKTTRGSEIVLHIAEDSEDFLEDFKINELLTKYAKFLPVPIQFGEKSEYDSEGKETGKSPKIINNTKPAWVQKPVDLKDEDYKSFYKELYPYAADPLFHIHLNVDYPFNLTGILYFPKLNGNFEVQKNKIQLYSNQVFVTDSVENIVPEFLTLMHGVIDSPDIPLNVSRSYLQSDSNVKKISSHITKKVSDKLEDIFKKDREDFEKKWDDIKVFIQYGMLSDEKFYEKAVNYTLFKNVDGKYFTIEEYKEHVKANQTDKENKLVYLYTSNKNEQYSFIHAAKDRGYDVLILDGQLDNHFINQLEQKFENTAFVRVDADTIDKLINKEISLPSKLSDEQQNSLRPVFESQVETGKFTVTFESLSESDDPIIITRPEFMRRMKDMSAMGGSYMGMGNMPDMFNMVINSNHSLVAKVLESKDAVVSKDINVIESELTELNKQLATFKKDKETEEAHKLEIDEVNKFISENETKKKNILREYGKSSDLVKQLTDLALLSQNMLTGEELTKFIKRSVSLIG